MIAVSHLPFFPPLTIFALFGVSVMTALERLVQIGSEELKNLNEELKEAGEDVTELTQDTSELRSLVDTMNRLRDDAVKISQKKIQIEENQDDPKYYELLFQIMTQIIKLIVKWVRLFS